MPYIIIIVIIAVAGLAFTFMRTDDTPTITETPVIETTTEVPAAMTQGTYRNGAHTASATYTTPKRSEYKIDVSLTLTDDTVTDAAIVYAQGSENDKNAQRFEQAYKTEVIGKKLDEINLSRVGGASLTSNAFNDAVAKIKTEAQT